MTIAIPQISPSLFEINPEVLVKIQDELLSSKNKSAIKIHFKMGLEEEDGLKTITKEQNLSREEVMTMYTIFTCRSSSSLRINQFISRFLKVIAGDENQVIEMVASDSNQDNLVENDFILSAVCEHNDGNPYIKYFEIKSPELYHEGTNDYKPLTFNVVGKINL